MEQLIYRFTLDTHKNGSQRTLQGFETGDTLSRRFVISLVEGDKPYPLPLDNVVAVMYTQRPSQSSPSIYDCTIDGNSIIYDVSADDLIEAGTLTCQLKLISGTIANPEKVIVAPRFNVEIWESTTDDSEAEDSQEYTALETALIKAKMCYDARIVLFDIANDGTLTVVYGMVDDYRATKEYVADDKVFYNNKAWKCLQTCTGETPEEGDYWTEIPLDEAHITYTSDYFKDNIAPSIEVGTVTEGDTMSVTNSGTALHAVFDFQLVKGDKGEDGFSAVANVAKVGDTATITITDKEGTTTAEISDGEDGVDGQDGYSPTATVTKSGDTATITITDKNGTTTAQVSDGTGTTTTWNQIQQSGDKIAEITINGTKTDVYSPTPSTPSMALGDLTDVTTTGASIGQVLTKKATGYEFDDIVLPNGNALFIGDSYSDKSTGYTDALPELIGSLMNYDNIFNYAIAGAGYVNGSGTQEHFEGQFDSAMSELTASEKANIKYVYVLGGQNDNGQTTTNLVNACISLFVKIGNTLPNAKIIALPLWYNRALSEANCVRFPIIYNCAMTYNCLTDTNSWAYLLNKSVGFMVDGVHPTQDGLRFLSGCICNLVKGGNSLIPQNDLITIDTNIISSTPALMTNYSNGFVHINGDFVAGSNGIPNQTTIFTVDPIFAPQKGAYYQIPQLGANSTYMFILGSDGTFKAYQAVPASTQLAINISWSMCS